MAGAKAGASAAWDDDEVGAGLGSGSGKNVAALGRRLSCGGGGCGEGNRGDRREGREAHRRRLWPKKAMRSQTI